MSFEGQNLQQMDRRVKILKNFGNIHVHNHYIQRPSFLKPLDQSKSHFIGSIFLKGEPK